MRRIILFSYLLFISFFCFAQQNFPVKIIGVIPAADSGKKYQIQVGAYKFEKNAQDAVLKLKNIDLQPASEKFRDFTRVLVKEIPANQVRSILSSIANAGFREVIIREDTSPKKQEDNFRQPETNYWPPEIKNRQLDILCKTWIIESCPNQELIGSQLFILDDGTYYVTNINGESSSVSEWRRNGDNGFEYSHNDWEYYGMAEIIKITDNSFELIDSGYIYDTPGRSSAGYSNHWVFSGGVDRFPED